MLFFFVLGVDEPAHRPRQIAIDEALFERIGQGDMQALEALYLQTERTVYAYTLSLLKNPDDTVDIVQEVYIKIRASAHLYQPMGKPLAWMFTIARNLCMNLLRKNSLRRADNLDDIEDHMDFSYVTDAADRYILESALAILSEGEREIVLLHAISGMKHNEIAKSLDVPLSTALSRYHRALAKLKKHLTEQGVRV